LRAGAFAISPRRRLGVVRDIVQQHMLDARRIADQELTAEPPIRFPNRLFVSGTRNSRERVVPHDPKDL